MKRLLSTRLAALAVLASHRRRSGEDIDLFVQPRRRDRRAAERPDRAGQHRELEHGVHERNRGARLDGRTASR